MLMAKIEDIADISGDLASSGRGPATPPSPVLLLAVEVGRVAGRVATALVLTPPPPDNVTPLVLQALILWDRGALADGLDLAMEAVRIATDHRPDPRHFQPHLFLAARRRGHRGEPPAGPARLNRYTRA